MGQSYRNKPEDPWILYKCRQNETRRAYEIAVKLNEKAANDSMYFGLGRIYGNLHYHGLGYSSFADMMAKHK